MQCRSQPLLQYSCVLIKAVVIIILKGGMKGGLKGGRNNLPCHRQSKLHYKLPCFYNCGAEVTKLAYKMYCGVYFGQSIDLFCNNNKSNNNVTATYTASNQEPHTQVSHSDACVQCKAMRFLLYVFTFLLKVRLKGLLASWLCNNKGTLIVGSCEIGVSALELPQ